MVMYGSCDESDEESLLSKKIKSPVVLLPSTKTYHALNDLELSFIDDMIAKNEHKSAVLTKSEVLKHNFIARGLVIN